MPNSSILLSIPIAFIFVDVLDRYKFQYKAKSLGIPVFIIVLSSNVFYFKRKNRWKKIIKRFSNKESDTVSFRRGLLIFFVILVYITLMLLWSNHSRAKIETAKRIKYEQVKDKKKYAINEFTYFHGFDRFILYERFNWDESKRIRGKLGERSISPDAEKLAADYPDGWLYEINNMYGENGDVSIEGILGAWRIDSNGKAVEYFPNPDYIPVVEDNWKPAPNPFQR